MRRALALVLILGGGCAAGPDVELINPDVALDRSLRIAVLGVEEMQQGFDPAKLQDALAEKLASMGWSCSTAPKEAGLNEWTPARAALATRERKADLALIASILPSQIPIHPRDPVGAFGEPLYPRPLPGRWVIVRVRLIDVRLQRAVYVASIERKEAGLREPMIADLLLTPLGA